MAKKQEQLPEFVVDGEFEDHAWREVAAKQRRTDAEEKMVKAGPRLHPFGPAAYRDEADDGSVRWFADKQSAQKWRTSNEPEKEATRRATPSPTEGGPEQAAATRKGIESAEEVQRKGQDTGHGGNRGRTGR